MSSATGNNVQQLPAPSLQRISLFAKPSLDRMFSHRYLLLPFCDRSVVPNMRHSLRPLERESSFQGPERDRPWGRTEKLAQHGSVTVPWVFPKNPRITSASLRSALAAAQVPDSSLSSRDQFIFGRLLQVSLELAPVGYGDGLGQRHIAPEVHHSY